MALFIEVLIFLIAFLHIYFLFLEMFLWTKPYGLKVFKQSKETALTSAPLAANQGLYNGFLAAGLIWGAVHPHPALSFQIRIFFLTCVTIAGLYGAYSVNKRILIIQAAPAAITLCLILFSK